jgi:N-acetylmuramoyl-L-alanine amidase
LFEVVKEPVKQKTRPIHKIIWHVSDSPDTLDVGAKEINEWHRQRGWRCIGYHYVVRRSGVIEKGREDALVGSHTLGQNHDSLGLVWVGVNDFNPEQKAAMVKLTKDLMALYGVTAANVYGHREFNNAKTCPNLDPNDIREWIHV